MGVAAHHFISAVSLIIAQRLIRKLCVHCKTLSHQHYIPVGCHHCYQGYQDRIGLFEFIPITEKIASLILSGANAIQLQKIIQDEQWLSLWNAGMTLVQYGITSYSELLRIVGKE
jgi:type II secretory ATPase GspE/PulE/Tfp pilus assembly ATPase PilB-like protein